MRLKSLELQGFKSFPDKTVISFYRGITVVVGPNGSGKSNISDAMRWVLGEMSSKNIRGGKMEDVVFAGSQKRSPMGYAEVSVTFDNTEEEGKILSLSEYDEITVTRRYYRVGDSEYFINRKPVRLKDIHELFLNTGLGRDGYSIIGQGRIAEIISQKNDERRAIFEEAAGIARYRYQKTEAAKKLSDTEANLVRIEDIASVLGERVGPLEKESEKAKKYLEIRDAKMAVDIALSLFDIDSTKVVADELSAKLVLAKAELDDADETRASLEAAEEKAREDEMQNKIETERISARILEVSGAIHENEAAVRLAENDAAHLTEIISTSEERLRTSEEMRILSRKEEERIEGELERAETHLKTLEKMVSSSADAVFRLEKAIAENECALNDCEKELSALRTEQTNAVVEASVAAAQKESDKQKCTELEKNIEKHKADVEMLNGRIRTAEEKITAYLKKEEAIKKELDTIDAEKSENEKKTKALSEKKNNLFLDISQRKHKIQNLTRMEELLEGYSGAVRFLVNEHKDGKIRLPSGAPIALYGPVSKLITVPDRYSAALEVAFGQSLQNIVVEDDASAKAAIAYLKKKNAGRATLYPISTMRGNEISENDIPAAHREGFVSVASALVECDEKFRGIVRSLLGRILIATDMDSANKIAKAMNFRYRIVTLDGQVINAGGSFTGGSLSPDGRMLSRRVQIEKLGEEVKSLEISLAAAETDLKTIAEEMASAKKKEIAVLSSATGVKTMHDAEKTQLTVLISNRDAQNRALSELCVEYEALIAKTSRAESDMENIDKKRSEYTVRLEAFLAESEKLSLAKTKMNGELEQARAAFSTSSLEKAKADAGIEMLLQMMAATKKRTDEINESIEALRASAAEAKEKIGFGSSEIGKMKEKALSLKAELSDLENKKAQLSETSMLLEKKLNDFRIRNRNILDKRDLLYRTYTKMESEYHAMRERQEKLMAFLWDEYELTYSEANRRSTDKVTKENRQEAVSAQNKYKNQLRALGTVNVNAIEEYKEVKKQFEDLSAQIEDLKKSKESLLEIISALEVTMQNDFLATVEEINVNFGRVFTELFGGGRAEIRLSDPANVLESGIDINVAPPGKVIKNMSLLSGGEQAFVAIALYFAILKVNPAPFCILDEIEAALDDINVDKFADYVKKYSDKTQFVIITHRRGTMEAAERLYGVTMHEKGISDVISIDVSEIEQKIGVQLR